MMKVRIIVVIIMIMVLIASIRVVRIVVVVIIVVMIIIAAILTVIIIVGELTYIAEALKVYDLRILWYLILKRFLILQFDMLYEYQS